MFEPLVAAAGADSSPLPDGRAPERSRSGTSARIVAAVVTVWTALFASWLAFGWGGRAWAPAIDLVLFAGIGVAAAWQQLRVVRLVSVRRDRLAWALLFGASISRLTSGSVWGVFIALTGPVSDPPWLVVLASLYLVFGIAALVAFQQREIRGDDRVRYGLDRATVLLGSLLLAWYTAIGPLLRASEIPPNGLPSLLYTVGDAATVLLAATLCVRAMSRTTRAAATVLLFAFVLQLVPDIGFLNEDWFASYEVGDPVEGFWYAVWLLKWLAAWIAEARERSDVRSAQDGPYDGGVVPHLFLVAAIGILLAKLVTGDVEDRALFGVGTAVLALLLIARESVDLRDRDRLQATSRAEETRNHALVQHAFDVVLLIGHDLRIRYASPATEALLGQGVVGRPARGLLRIMDRGDRRAAASAVREAGSGPQSLRLRIRDRSSDWHALDCVVQDLRGDPAIGGVLINGLDRTREARLASRLHETQEFEALGVLASGLAHDLNNVLTVIGSHLDLVDDDRTLPAVVHPDLLRLRAASDRAKALTGGLLLLSRRKSGTPTLVALASLVTDRAPAQRALVLGPAAEVIRVRGEAAAVGQLLDATVDEAARAHQGTTADLSMTVVSRLIDAAEAARVGIEPGQHALVTIGDPIFDAPVEVSPAVSSAASDEWDLAPSEVALLIALATAREMGGAIVREHGGGRSRLAVYLPAAVA